MFETPITAVKPTGTLVFETLSTGATFRYREGLAVHVYDTGNPDSPLHCFEVFVADRFVTGWPTLEQAIACAERW